MSDINKVVLVGHCVPDTFLLRSLVSRTLPMVALANVNDQVSLEAEADSQTLLLVNRVLDGSFDAANGIELIQDFCARDGGPKAVLISNYDDAQEQAVKVGAEQGFGKSELEGKGTETLLQLVG